MPRSRILKIGFFENEVLAGLPPMARLLFCGLWLLADREGRLHDRPVRIWGQLFPFDTSIDVDNLLEQLAANDFIRRYSVDGARCIWIPKFTTHQKPHIKETASEIPKYLAIPQSRGSASAEHLPEPGREPGESRLSRPISVSTSVSVCDSASRPFSVCDPKTESVSQHAKPQSSHERTDRLKDACQRAIQIDSPNNSLEHLTEVVRQVLPRPFKGIEPGGSKFTEDEIKSMLELVVTEHREAARL